ncbi:MAG: hypothetical protein IID61_07970 [SAR324 cluster bacterium]|nr:hypothetical protein [SAR324 cluster bacterium]
MNSLRPHFPDPKGMARRRPVRANFARKVFGAALLVVSLFAPAQIHAQTSFEGDGGGLLLGTAFAETPQLFPPDDRTKLLILGINPIDVTESAAEQIGLILQKNLSNIAHFSVVGPRETDALYESQRPDLIDCREIACGVESGKFLGADKVLVSRIQRRGEGFFVRVRLIEIINNLTDFEESVRFNDSNMDEVLFRLANSISDNTLIVGRVLSSSIRGIVLDLGIKDGLKLGDFLIIYKEDVPITDLEGEVIDVQRKTLAIVKTLRVNDNTSEALLVHSVEDPQITHYAATFRNPARQTKLLEETRRELDTGIRLANKLRPLELAPVALADEERKNWRIRIAQTVAEKTLWATVATIGAIVSVVLFSTFDNTDLERFEIAAAIAVTGYGGFKWLASRDELNQLKVEGLTKGYLQAGNFRMNVGPDSLSLGLAYNF